MTTDDCANKATQTRQGYTTERTPAEWLLCDADTGVGASGGNSACKLLGGFLATRFLDVIRMRPVFYYACGL